MYTSVAIIGFLSGDDGVLWSDVCLVHQSLSGETPACQADSANLVSDNDRRLLWSVSDNRCVVPCTQQFRRQFWCCWSACINHRRTRRGFIL